MSRLERDDGTCVTQGGSACCGPPILRAGVRTLPAAHLPQEGTYLGDGVTCAEANTSCLGACCATVSGACHNGFSETSCTSGGSGTFLGLDTTCASAANTTCPIGACCVGGTCEETDGGAYFTEAYCIREEGIYLGDRTVCGDEDCPGACTTCCSCSLLNEDDCASIGGEFHGINVRCESIDFAPDATPPVITCPSDITLDRGDKICAANVQNWLDGATATDNCGTPQITSNASDCGFPYGGTTTVTFTAEDDCENTVSCTATITVGPAPRVDISKKGSLLAFSKVDLRWDAAGVLTQDTFLTLTNDYPDDVYVQLYFVNGDALLDPLFSNTQPPVLLAEGEPGWNWVDCQVLLTPDQPIYWSASTGTPAGCQPFTILDPDLGSGPGRPVPGASDGSRMLRGFVLAFAVDQAGREIQWNHLSGKATLVDYANTSAWEYEAAAFQTNCRAQGDEPPDCTLFDEQGVCCAAEIIPGALGLDGFQYDYAFGALLLDFFGVGSTALSGPATSVTVDTDLTLHILSADLRQETNGPVTTKGHFDIWNSNERKLSNTRRCLTCWDQTLLSQYGGPNSFLRDNLQTDKGKARIDGKRADECEENCFRDEEGEPLEIEELIELVGDLFNQVDVTCSEDAALLGLAAKHLAFSGPAGQRDAAGSPLVGMGVQSATLRYDIIQPPGSLREQAFERIGRELPREHERLEPAKAKSRG